MHTKTSKHTKPFSKYSIALFAAAIFLIPGGWLFTYVWHWQHLPHILDVHCLSVDGETAVFIRTPDGHTALVDGGKSNDIAGDLTSLMPFYDRTIDTVILTNDDDSHATGLVSVLERYRVKRVYEMDATDQISATMATTTAAATSSSYVTFENLIASKNITDKKVGEGDQMNIGELVSDVVFPPTSDFKFSKTNAPTLAFSFDYGSTTLFFAGTITKTEQKYLANEIASSSIMILPKGENVNMVDGGFFNAVHPDYVVVSKKPRAASAASSKNPPETASIATTTKTGKPKKPPKPPFSILDSGAPGVSIINLATDGNAEFVSNGETFSEIK